MLRRIAGDCRSRLRLEGGLISTLECEYPLLLPLETLSRINLGARGRSCQVLLPACLSHTSDHAPAEASRHYVLRVQLDMISMGVTEMLQKPGNRLYSCVQHDQLLKHCTHSSLLCPWRPVTRKGHASSVLQNSCQAVYR